MGVSTLTAIDVSWVEQTPELDDLQTGAIRRIANLSRQLTGDWSGMMGRDIVLAEDFSALRFQLSYMGYALALAHVHRLPAAPGVFKQPFENIISQVMHPDAWLYWSHVSTGMGPFNKDLGPLKQEFDPVAKDNIMYSAYLQSLALMYHYLFRDDKYAREGSLRLRINSTYWHEGGFTFDYDEKSLNSLIYWQMAEQGFLGVACEPGCVFQICNQPNIIGFRMHDMIYGGNLAGEARDGYIKAWEEFGMLDDAGNFKTVVLLNSRTPITLPHPQMNFWLMTLLHSWYPDIVDTQYPLLMERILLDGPNGTKWIKPVPHVESVDGAEPLLPVIDIAWAACAASEVGDTETLDGLLGYADLKLNSAWQDGGYYYKRRDANYDENGYFIGMDAAAGNALLHYARLNVKDGLKKLFDGPLDDAHFEQPALIGLPDDLDIRRAIFDPQRNALALTLGALPAGRRIRLDIRAPEGSALPIVIKDGIELEGGIARTDAGLSIELDHHDRSTLVFQW
ncbi:hypothetical protein [Sphingobium sp.]|uniref:linalool dehydratase/isomerase domain-containing protein n=1 Tax=Sphingobium sp. TaxID=1912891 RepID=UPI0028BD5A2A|nr:hypothetical protein [Sphingobium sp.]